MIGSFKYDVNEASEKKQGCFRSDIKPGSESTDGCETKPRRYFKFIRFNLLLNKESEEKKGSILPRRNMSRSPNQLFAHCCCCVCLSSYIQFLLFFTPLLFAISRYSFPGKKKCPWHVLVRQVAQKRSPKETKKLFFESFQL